MLLSNAARNVLFSTYNCLYSNLLNSAKPTLLCLRSNSLAQSVGFHTTGLLSWTLQQMHMRGGPPPRPNRRVSKVSGYGFLKGTVLQVIIKRPHKPNSGNRKCVIVKLKDGREEIAYIPGIGHNLQEHSQVLVKGGRKKDIGVRLVVVRGKFDCNLPKKQVHERTMPATSPG